MATGNMRAGAKAMVTASRRGFDLFLCDQCVGEMAEIIAARIRA
jgi:hypothetical protein